MNQSGAHWHSLVQPPSCPDAQLKLPAHGEHGANDAELTKDDSAPNGGQQEEIDMIQIYLALCQMKNQQQQTLWPAYLQPPSCGMSKCNKFSPNAAPSDGQIALAGNLAAGSSRLLCLGKVGMEPLPLIKIAKYVDKTALYQQGQQRYLLSPHVLQGGFGKFRLALANGQHLLGVKVVRLQAKMNQTQATSPMQIAAIEREIHLQNTYGRHNKISQIWAHQAKWMLVMPAFDGSLTEWMRLSSWRTAEPVIRQRIARIVLSSISQQLQNMHQANIIHRDIKPDNILVDKTLGIELCDFGLAIDLGKKCTISGTDDFFAPELLANAFGSCSKASDVWSLGITVLSVLGGQGFCLLDGHNTHSPPDQRSLLQHRSAQLIGYFDTLRLYGCFVEDKAQPQSWLVLLKQAYATDQELTNWLLHSFLLTDPQQRISIDQLPAWFTSPTDAKMDIKPSLQKIYQIQLAQGGPAPASWFAKQRFLEQARQYGR